MGVRAPSTSRSGRGGGHGRWRGRWSFSSCKRRARSGQCAVAAPAARQEELEIETCGHDSAGFEHEPTARAGVGFDTDAALIDRDEKCDQAADASVPAEQRTTFRAATAPDRETDAQHHEHDRVFDEIRIRAGIVAWSMVHACNARDDSGHIDERAVLHVVFPTRRTCRDEQIAALAPRHRVSSARRRTGDTTTWRRAREPATRQRVGAPANRRHDNVSARPRTGDTTTWRRAPAMLWAVSMVAPRFGGDRVERDGT